MELVRAGRRPSELSKEFGCHASSIHNWLRQADQARGISSAQTDALSASERQELLALHRQLRQVQMERDILAKAGPSLQESA